MRFGALAMVRVDRMSVRLIEVEEETDAFWRGRQVYEEKQRKSPLLEWPKRVWEEVLPS
jgi:hypothetical protein